MTHTKDTREAMDAREALKLALHHIDRMARWMMIEGNLQTHNERNQT